MLPSVTIALMLSAPLPGLHQNVRYEMHAQLHATCC
jgi:hypothetical protein